MPVDDLPIYPTPQQAAYVVEPSSHSSGRSSKPGLNVIYRPQTKYPPNQGLNQKIHYNHSGSYEASNSQKNYQQSPQAHSSQQPYYQSHQPSQQQYNYHSQGTPQSQYIAQPTQYYQQQTPAPVQHAHTQHYASAPLPQTPTSQAYPPPPLPQTQRHYSQELPPTHTPQEKLRVYSQDIPQPHQQTYYRQQSYEGTSPSKSHVAPQKKPPPTNYGSPNAEPQQPAQSRSKDSLPEKGSYPSKASSKQKLENELRAVFEKVDINKSGKISPRELSLALLNFDHTRFRDSTIILMIKLFGGSSGKSTVSSLNFDQFVALWKYLSAYKKLFLQADINKSGDISFGEFQKILEQIGYKLNIDLVLHLFQKFCTHEESSTVGKLKFDSFIELLVYLRKLTDIFKKYDKDLSGVATINFLDFLFEISNLS